MSKGFDWWVKLTGQEWGRGSKSWFQVLKSALAFLSLVPQVCGKGLFCFKAQELKHNVRQDDIFSLAKPIACDH